MGFPFADIECMGVTVIVVTDDDQELAQTMVDRLAQKLWSLREELQPKLVSIRQAMDLSLQTDGLVIFADGSDNPGGGAPCDGTVALRALIEARHAGAGRGNIVGSGGSGVGLERRSRSRIDGAAWR